MVAQYDPGQGIPTQRYIINDSGFKNGADGLLVLDNVPIVDLGDSSLVSELKKTLEDLANDPPEERSKLSSTRKAKLSSTRKTKTAAIH